VERIDDAKFAAVAQHPCECGRRTAHAGRKQQPAIVREADDGGAIGVHSVAPRRARRELDRLGPEEEPREPDAVAPDVTHRTARQIDLPPDVRRVARSEVEFRDDFPDPAEVGHRRTNRVRLRVEREDERLPEQCILRDLRQQRFGVRRVDAERLLAENSAPGGDGSSSPRSVLVVR
jgi:hypothetical protein